jgi:putative endonuclease
MSIQPAVYIVANRRNGTLYVGVTGHLLERAWQHRSGLVPGFTAKYRLHRLVWFELHPTLDTAIPREKAIKEWRRAWKIELIEKTNP